MFCGFDGVSRASASESREVLERLVGVPTSEPHIAPELATGRLQQMWRFLALGDETVSRRESLVPFAEDPEHADSVPVQEADERSISDTLSAAERLVAKLFDTKHVREVQDDREVVESAGDHRRVRRPPDLDRTLHVRPAGRVSQELLRRADRRQRVHAQVDEGQVLGDRECLLRAPSPLFVLAGQHLLAAGPSEHPRDARRRFDTYDQRLGRVEVEEDLALLSPKPGDPSEKCLALGRGPRGRSPR